MSNALDQVIEELPELLSVMSESKPLVLGLDIGTSGVRAALFGEGGGEVAGASIRLKTVVSSFTETGTADADFLVEEVANAIDSLFARLSTPAGRVEFIAVSCFWHSLVGINEAGGATTPVFGWSDPKAATVARELRSKLDEAKVHARTGCRIHPSYWPAKLARLRTVHPEIFRVTTRWVSFAEYLALKFYGETAASVSMASGTGLMNVHTCEWDDEWLEILDLNVESLPVIASASRCFLGLTDNYAVRWPQLIDARMLPAIGDGAANNIGVGCLSTNKVALTIGSSGAMRTVFRGDPPAKVPPELFCYRADRNRVVVGGALSDGGGMYEWIRNVALRDYDNEAIETELASLEPDAHGLTVLPFWTGERSTGWAPDARGAILGLTIRTRPIEILLAAMEAVAYRFALIANGLDHFAPDATVITSGHALRSSRTWTQILADVLGRPVIIPEVVEASTRGAALLALEAVGKIQSLEDFSVPIETIIEPDMSHHVRYQSGLERQERMYEKVILKT